MNSSELLRKKAFAGLKEKALLDKQNYVDRLEYELSVIKEMGFDTYFLITQDFVRYARKTQVCGPGRGSACGSLLSFLLGITLVDPIKYNLYFERFINPGRKGSPPDIDLDFSDRDKIIEYLEEQYGKDRVARVGNIGFLRTKSAIRDICRVLEKPYNFAEELANLVPPPRHGLWDSFEDEAEVEPRLLDEKYKEIIDPVQQMWGLARNFGTHAGGVVISPIEISKVAPLFKDRDGNLVTQFDYRDLETIGLLKFDLLGVSTLEVIRLTLESLEEQGIKVELENLEDGDEKAYKLICEGDLDGVFQLGGSESIKTLAVAYGPKCIEDLSTVSATFRPGPLSLGLLDTMIDIRNGKAKAQYLHPALKPILSETYGIPIFQEQCMRICTDMGGYSLADADKFRKILGKKLKEKMPEEKKKLVAGMASKGISQKTAADIFSMLENYATYLFNASHAVAYSFISYWTAYLKAHYPVEFYAALMSCERKTDTLIRYASAVKSRGIEILSPDVNRSGVHHKPEGKSIRYGLAHIKDIGLAAAENIVKCRKNTTEI